MTEENLEESFEDDASTKVLYDQLQTEYNKLLKQYAAAENTIDELRTGATVHLSTKPLESRRNSRLNFEAERYSQTINFPRAHQASTSSVSAISEMSSKNATGGHNFVNEDERVKFATHEQNTQQNLTLRARIQALKEDVDTVESVLSESGVSGEGLNEVVVICTQLRKEHGVLTHKLKLQSRNVNICRPTLSDTNHLSTRTELGKELYRIGLHIEEIQRDFTASIKAKNAPSEVKFVKPQNGDKPPLNSHLRILIKEMKDLKDASIKNSEGVLNNSRMDNTTLESVSPHKKSSKMSSKEQRHLEPEQDVLDSRYFSASPVNMESDPQNIHSGSEGSGGSGDQMFNMTWPRSRSVIDTGSSNTLRSYLETTEDYNQDSPESSQGSLNPAHDHKSLDGERHLNSAQSKTRMNSDDDQSTSDHIKVNNGQTDRLVSPTNLSILNEYRQRSQNTEDVRTDNFGPNSKPRDSIRHSSGEKHSSQFTQDLDRSKAKPCDRERKDHSENTPYSRQETLHQKDEQSQLPKLTLNFNQNTKHHLRSPDTDSGPQKFNSMSSLADSSRMSTPLFQPRGATRVSPPRYKRRNPSDGFDSGFVGSEASRSSRLTTDHPDGVQKLNFSNQLDSSLHLDLVSEMNENESSSSPEQASTAYELTEDDRRSPRETIRSCQLEDSKFVNTSPSPPSSPERIPRTPAKYFGYKTSDGRLRGSGNSLPGHDTGLSDQSLSHVSERLSLDRRSSLDRCSSVRISCEYSDSGSRDVAPDVTADNSERVKSQDKTNQLKNERKLQSLRDELHSLRDHMNKLDDPRDVMDMYDELRHHDKQLRRVQERKHEQNLVELRQTIERLNRDIKSRYRSEKHRRKPDRNPEFYDDFRSELQKVTGKLDELTTLRNTSDGLSESPYTNVSRHDYDDIDKRFSNLVRKVDELRHRIENDAPRENSRYFCHHCNEVGGHHHGHRTVVTADYQPRTSTPFVSDVQPTSGEATTAKLDHRSYLCSTYPDVLTHQPPVIHHIHTYHRDTRLKQPNESESSSDDDNYVKRTPPRKRRVHRSRYRTRRDISYDDFVSLDEARKAARDVQRLSKNILNSITFDLASLRS